MTKLYPFFDADLVTNSNIVIQPID